MTSTTSNNVAVVVQSTEGFQDFATRRSQPGVRRWTGFDVAGDLGNTTNPTPVIFPGPDIGAIQDTPGFSPVWDPTFSASADGGGSLKFTVVANAAGTASGDWFFNFGTVASPLHFDEGETFYVQYRHYVSQEAMDALFLEPFPNSCWKFNHIGAGDKDGSGGTFGDSNPARENSTSCDVSELVLQPLHFAHDLGGREVVLFAYHCCPSQSPNGQPVNFEDGQVTAWNAVNFRLQDARSNYCVRYLGQTYDRRVAPSQTPAGTCIGVWPNEWMTYTWGITLGAWGDMQNAYGQWGYVNSRVRLWAARQGQVREPVYDRIISLRNSFSSTFHRGYGKFWANTFGTAAYTHPAYSIWYDEVIISSNDIADTL